MLAILFLSGLSKFVAGASPNPAFDLADKVFPFLTARQVQLAVALLEFATVVAAWLGRSEIIKVVLLGVLAAGFSAYRVVLAVGGFPEQCDCFGKLWQALGLADAQIIKLNHRLYWVFMASFMAYLFFLYTTGRKRNSSVGARQVRKAPGRLRSDRVLPPLEVRTCPATLGR